MMLTLLAPLPDPPREGVSLLEESPCYAAAGDLAGDMRALAADMEAQAASDALLAQRMNQYIINAEIGEYPGSS